MTWIYIALVVMVVCAGVVMRLIATAMDYDPAWDEEDHDDHTGRT